MSDRASKTFMLFSSGETADGGKVGLVPAKSAAKGRPEFRAEALPRFGCGLQLVALTA
jgi:hypothetical protein